MTDEFVINISEVEELQTLNDRTALDKLFTKAKRTIISGGKVVLVRKYAEAYPEKIEEFTLADDLADYKNKVYKYLGS